MLSKEIREIRLTTCKVCPQFSKLLGGVCKSCGCSMLLKTWLEDSECPLNKWQTNIKV